MPPQLSPRPVRRKISRARRRRAFNDPWRPVLVGATAGFLATAPMTAFMAAAFQGLRWYERYPLPPRQITMKGLRSTGLAHTLHEEGRKAATAVAHFGYGAAMGAIYGRVRNRKQAPQTRHGILFGLAVWAASYGGYLPSLGILPPPTRQPARRTALMIGAHVVWGVALEKFFYRLNRKGRKST